MTFYNLERFTVLIVEDNGFIRNTLRDLLQNLGVGTIKFAENGADAIEFLKSVKTTANIPGGLNIDLIVSDMIMSPINGLLLARWVRQAKESPNRFIPYIMLSGAADNAYVASARDLGATEFVAKPFSATSMYEKILEVIDHPRNFIACHSYNGPDRRRKATKRQLEDDQRTLTEADATIVYSAGRVVKPKDETDLWIFKLPNSLKEKAGGLGKGATPGEIPNDILEKAEAQLQTKKLDFTDWALNYLAELSDHCTRALANAERRNANFEKINLLAHELRGQGGTFGYPLITVFGKMLYEVTQDGCRMDDSAVEIVKAHIDAMRVVLREKIAGDGGALGKKIYASLQAAIQKNNQKSVV